MTPKLSPSTIATVRLRAKGPYSDQLEKALTDAGVAQESIKHQPSLKGDIVRFTADQIVQARIEALMNEKPHFFAKD